MWRSEWRCRVVSREVGSALSGQDAPCPDGVYRKCRTYRRDGDIPRAVILEALAKEFPEAHEFHLFGPFSAGD